MTDKPNQRRWRNLLIRRDVQLPIIATNLVFLAVVTAVLIAVLLSPLYIDMLHGGNLWLRQASGKLFLILSVDACRDIISAWVITVPVE
jgi:hypothetical protein